MNSGRACRFDDEVTVLESLDRAKKKKNYDPDGG